MPIFRLNEEIVFPDPALADDSGLLAVGGDLSARRLLAAYSLGIFPWYEEGLPILWHSPDPRFLLGLDDLRVNRSLKKDLRNFEVTFDSAFEEVIDGCGEMPRPGQHGTWITRDLRNAFVNLHELGFAHSVEARMDGKVVGGLYGLSLGAAFFGESMYHERSGASKVALVRLVERLRDWSFELLDCQVYTPHLEEMGAKEIPRSEFLSELEHALGALPTRRGSWSE